jgi:hypothetical protein
MINYEIWLFYYGPVLAECMMVLQLRSKVID